MYPPMTFEDGEQLELRPMNCPHHILVYDQDLHSYRELPVRIAELGQNWRLEKSGELAGLIRVRSFTLNDAHIFCTPEQLRAEILGVMDLAKYFMDTLGVTEITPRLSIWDDDRDHWLGSDEQWHNAIEALRGALEEREMDYFEGRGEAAFYGPKIDYQVRDAAGREFTNNTIQVDFQQPDRFDLEYVADDGSRQRPVMIHRGAFGSMERMMAFLIEKYAGAFPTWLHPVQVVVIPITDAQAEYADRVAERLRKARLRVTVDSRPERMNKKIRDAQHQRLPYMAVLGGREAENGQVSVRNRSGEQSEEELDAFADRVALEVAERRLA
jgi:threonyl-tRNA synthetase